LEFINELGLSKTKIDRLPDEQVRHFATWFRNRPRKDGRAGSRSVEQINNAVSEVKLAFYKVGVRDRFVSSDKVPNIDRLKQQPDDRYKRDIMELDQYEKYWRYLEYKYQREKGLTDLEKNRRIVFTKAIGILANTGLRPKELLGLRWIDISHYPNAENEDRKRIAVIHIRKENEIALLQSGKDLMLSKVLTRKSVLIFLQLISYSSIQAAKKEPHTQDKHFIVD
jgi:hypothetical protein